MTETSSHDSAILVVEDDIMYRQQIVGALKEVSIPVVTTTNGEEAWNIVQNQVVKVVVLDIVMPTADGLWFLEQVRNHIDYKNLPIIVLTNLEHGEKIGRAITQGVSRLLVKSEEALKDLPNLITEVLAE